MKEENLISENLTLREELDEYKDLINAIKNGEVDALAIVKDGQPNIFSLESTDFVYRVLVENFAEGALNVTDKGLIIYANPAFENLLSSSHASIIGTEILSLVDQKSQRTFKDLFRNSFSGQSKGEITLSFNGRKKQVYVSMSSLYPRFPGIGVIVTDLSEKKQQEETISNYKTKLSKQEEELLQAEILHKSTEHFRMMADVLPHKVWTADANGHIDYFNKKWLDYTGLNYEELKGWGWKKSIHPDDWPETERLWKLAIERGTNFDAEHRVHKHDGSYTWYHSRAIAQTDDTGFTRWVGTATDIQDQKHATNKLEEKIAERTAFILQVLDSSVELITTYDTDLNYTSVNKTALEYMNLKASDVIGKHILDVYPELANTVHYSYLQQILSGEQVYKTNINGIFKEGLVFESYFKTLIVNGKMTGVLVMARNITEIIHSNKKLEEMNNELKDKNLELVLSNAELASFSFIASHDLQEPLRKIQTFIDRILDKQSAQFSDDTNDYFERITASAKKMRAMLDALLNYYKAGDSESFETSNLDTILEDVKRDLADVLKKSNAIIDSTGLPTLPVIPVHIHQVFSHLISNAVKFRKEKVQPCIRISSELMNEDKMAKELPLPKGKYWKISISDNGIGFDKSFDKKIFELFQRLHDHSHYPGTGIGLAICRKIIQSHNGLIKAKSEPGKGATFTIYLPLAKKTNEIA